MVDFENISEKLAIIFGASFLLIVMMLTGESPQNEGLAKVVSDVKAKATKIPAAIAGNPHVTESIKAIVGNGDIISGTGGPINTNNESNPNNQNIDSREDSRSMLTRSLPIEYPVKGGFTISSGYGYRSDPFTGQRRFHSGIDIPLRNRTAVFATGDGLVSGAGYSISFGNYVKIKHDHNYKSIYAHLSRIDVRMGQQVQLGQMIGASGNSGRSKGAHLHYQIKHNGRSLDPVSFMNRSPTAQVN